MVDVVGGGDVNDVDVVAVERVLEREKALEGDDLEADERALVQQCLAEISEGERFGDMVAKQYD